MDSVSWYLRTIGKTCVVVFSSLLMGGPFLVDARDDELWSRVVAAVEKKLETQWNAYLDTLHTTLKFRSSRTENFYVRSQLLKLSQNLEEEYAASTLVRKEENNRKNTKTFLAKDGKRLSSTTTPKTVAKKKDIQTSKQSATSSPLKPSAETIAEEIPETPKKNIAVAPVSYTPSYYVLSQSQIDITTLQTTRLERVNDLRISRNVKPYSLDSVLHKTAADRSNTMKEKGSADHRRTSKSWYYEYGQLEDRFKKRGVTFENVNRATFTENIWYAYIDCNDSDCTDEAVEGMRQMFEYFRSEEGKANDLHRRSMMHPLFKLVGVWIAVDEEKGILYATMHYATDVVEETEKQLAMNTVDH